MKSIPNVQFTIKANVSDAANATVASLLKLTLGQPPERGFDFATIRARNKVADALDKVKPGDATLELEDADFVTARQCVEAFRWGSANPEVIKFAELFGL